MNVFVAALFLMSCAAHAVRVIATKRRFVSPLSVMVALAVLAGTLPVVFLGDGDEARHGFVYFSLSTFR
jgi:hypothetical protein